MEKARARAADLGDVSNRGSKPAAASRGPAASMTASSAGSALPRVPHGCASPDRGRKKARRTAWASLSAERGQASP